MESDSDVEGTSPQQEGGIALTVDESARGEDMFEALDTAMRSEVVHCNITLPDGSEVKHDYSLLHDIAFIKFDLTRKYDLPEGSNLLMNDDVLIDPLTFEDFGISAGQNVSIVVVVPLE